MKKTMIISLALLCSLPVIATEKLRANLHPNSFYNKLSPDVVTPHIKWAVPLAGGKLKALVIAPVCQRETLELAQRLSIDCTPIMLFAYEEPYFKTTMLRHERKLMDPLFKEQLSKEYDVIILGKVFWKSLPDYMRESIIAKVKNGCGLVYIGAHEYEEIEALFTGGDTRVRDQLTHAVPLSFLPVFKESSSEKLLSIGKAGKGRTVRIDYGEPPANRTWQSLTPNWGYTDSTAHYEYYQSLLAKVITWAGKRDPDVVIGEVQIGQRHTEVDVSITLEAKNELAVKLELVMRDADNKEIASQLFDTKLKPGINKFERSLPIPAEGVHFFDLWVKDKQDILNWRSVAKNIERELAIESVTTATDMFAKGEAIEGKLVLNTKPKDGTRCLVKLVDNFSRLVSQHETPVAEREVMFKLDIRSALSLLMHIEAELYSSDSQLLSKTVKEVTVPNKEHDDFYFLMWAWSIHNIDNYITDPMLKQFYKDGVDSLYDCPPAASHGYAIRERILTRAKYARRANLNFVPYMLGLTSAAFESQEDPEKLERLRCYTSSDYRKRVLETIKASAPIVKAHGSSIYSLSINGEIGWRKDYCFSPSCQADFREYLKKTYSSIDALNKEWKQKYSDWEDVEPVTFEQAAASSNFVPWVDHRLHMEEVYADFLKFCGDEIRKIDPDAIVGIDESNNTTSFSGFNWWRLLNTLDYVGSYTHNANRFEQKEFTRSFLKQRPGYSGLWMGTYNCSEAYNRFIPWQTLFNGMNSVWWWIGYNNDGMCTWSALEPGLKPLPFYEQACEEIREIKEGIGKLLINSERQHDKIALFYSPESVHASFIVDGSDKHEDRSLYKSQMNFIYALEDCGLQYEFVAEEQLQAGVLAERDYKVLILPAIRALSDQGVADIKKYIEGGGMVLADVKPAIMNEHCRPRESSPLAECFENFAKEMQVVSCSKGKTVWMNNFMESYLADRGRGKNFEARTKLLALLEEAGVTPSTRLTLSEGGDVAGVEVARFKNGSAEYLCLLRDFQNLPSYKPQSINIKLSKNTHVYDARAGEYLGKCDTIDTSIESARARVFSLLPYSVDGIRLTLNQSAYRQGELLVCKAALITEEGNTGNHVLRVELVSPTGENHSWQGENVFVTADGSVDIERHLALNKAKGRWRLAVRDVSTGTTAETVFFVE